MSKARLATAWLDGCSGCHMSLLDMDERIVQIADKADFVYSPYVDTKDFPDEVDITLVEGAVATTGDRDKILKIREHTKILVSLGDCAVTGNVPAMRNPFGVAAVLDRAYHENVTDPAHSAAPIDKVPLMLCNATPVHETVKVDYYIPGCPPSADVIFNFVMDLLEGRDPNKHLKFG